MVGSAEVGPREVLRLCWLPSRVRGWLRGWSRARCLLALPFQTARRAGFGLLYSTRAMLTVAGVQQQAGALAKRENDAQAASSPQELAVMP